ncbi:MAG: hypothetical protein CMH56_08145 [Myxococcales bacterium]|nr:hypothetical protein [Myxococcales bacterium]
MTKSFHGLQTPQGFFQGDFMKRVIAPLSTLFLILACPIAPSGEGGGGDAPPADPADIVEDTVCPMGTDGGFSLCHLQNSESPNHIATGTTVAINGVVVTSPSFKIGNSESTRMGVFVSDDPVATWGAVLATYEEPDGYEVSVGDVVDLEGMADEFSFGAPGSETRYSLTSLTRTGATANLQAMPLSDGTVLTNELTGEAYEGVLVTMSDLTVTQTLEYGQFELSNGVIVDDSIYHHSAYNEEPLANITGVISYSPFENGYGFRLNPRTADDVESTGTAMPKTIPQLRDPAAEGYVETCPYNGDCAPVALSNMVVVSEAWVLDEDDDSGAPYLFGFFVADPTAVNDNGELLAFSGIQVAMAPGASYVATNSYTFGGQSDGTFAKPYSVDYEGFPRPGDVVNLSGVSSETWDMAQLRTVTVLEKLGTTDTMADVTMPLPAQFFGGNAETDANHPSVLRGGRPAVEAADSGGVSRDAVTASTGVESYEGVFVKLLNVETTEECVPYPYNDHMHDFGYFEVTGGVEIGGLFDHNYSGYWLNVAFDSTDRTCENTVNKCEDSRESGQVFGFIQGIVNYSYNVYRVNPRFDADIDGSFVAEGTPEAACASSDDGE